MINAINRGDYGWRAGNYSQFWGMSLDEGIRYRLGTNKPSRTVRNMNEIKTNLENVFLPYYFNAADKWPGKIHEPLDQGNCAASWAFSTAAVASDRISIQSMGHMTPMLSPQNLISCDTRNQGGCRGGQIDGAWWYLRRRGIVTEDCYPFSSSKTDSASQRPQCMMHSQSEKEIMKEIMDNGPVQAILEVYEDFFVYKSGVYRHSPVNNNKPPQFRKHGTHSVKITGTCSKDGRWDCENHACLVEADMINAINRGDYGWRAGNYSQFWGMSLDEGIRYRLGTNNPSRTVRNMNEIKTNLENVFLPYYFNAADKWPGKIHEPLDQGNCAASWAFSTAAVASDRISIQSMGHMTPMLSPQNLISCDTRNQGGCRGGQIDGAWWYLRRRGIVTEDCYPFSSSKTDSASQRPQCMMHSQSVGRGKRQATARCPNQSSYTNDIYQSTPAYRISSNEKEIMKEIMDNGPVQAILEVYEDFFVYKSGVYRHSPVNNNKPPQFRKHGTHSVKITG
ncbi:Tubulointerstitial nephritis antigen-like [Acipenser ruthenus]|uniref:Tubulointerstitial nephritis antigen-like n=1 Tax=Acipenser ruthenus TaxID=7906 RepID=A0A444UUC7_ACIRT|nr:Tubulointerstitial nephritis antigen-like [Acipenser ruthenus]